MVATVVVCHHPDVFAAGGLRVGNYSYVDKHLDLGELGGNRFGLVIRDVDADEETIMGAVASFKETGMSVVAAGVCLVYG